MSFVGLVGLGVLGLGVEVREVVGWVVGVVVF